MFKKPKNEMTVDEAKVKFIKHMWDILNYWETVNPVGVQPHESVCRYRMEGMLLTILSTLDGESGMFPGFKVVPIITKDDVKFYDEHGEKYMPKEDIGGDLHDLMYPIGRKFKLTADERGRKYKNSVD